MGVQNESLFLDIFIHIFIQSSIAPIVSIVFCAIDDLLCRKSDHGAIGANSELGADGANCWEGIAGATLSSLIWYVVDESQRVPVDRNYGFRRSFFFLVLFLAFVCLKSSQKQSFELGTSQVREAVQSQFVGFLTGGTLGRQKGQVLQKNAESVLLFPVRGICFALSGYPALELRVLGSFG